MKLKDGKITQCTGIELYEYWLTRGYDSVCSFSDFKQTLSDLGVKIMKGEEECQSNTCGDSAESE